MTRNKLSLTSLFHKLLLVIYLINKGYFLQGKRSTYTQSWQKLMTAIATSQLFYPELVPIVLARVQVPKSKMKIFTCILRPVSSIYTHGLCKCWWYFSNNCFAAEIHWKESCYPNCWNNLRSILTQQRSLPYRNCLT